MALHNGIDTIGYVSCGWYSETYSSGAGSGNIASLFVSYGLLETAPAPGLITGILRIGITTIKRMKVSIRNIKNIRVIK